MNETTTISLRDLPAVGAEFAGGVFAGLTTTKDGKHVAVILLPNKAQERMSWTEAVAWATEAGGQLPTRPVAALLYANLKPEFEPDWYWTADVVSDDTGNEDHASFAWYCYFGDGFQFHNRKSSAERCRAVRLIHLAD